MGQQEIEAHFGLSPTQFVSTSALTPADSRDPCLLPEEHANMTASQLGCTQPQLPVLLIPVVLCASYEGEVTGSHCSSCGPSGVPSNSFNTNTEVSTCRTP